MKYRIEMRSGDSEISGLFYQSSIPTAEVALAIACAVVQVSFYGQRPLQAPSVPPAVGPSISSVYWSTYIAPNRIQL
jgi:hypothetical protein